jgi:LacI family transcriptional regulator
VPAKATLQDVATQARVHRTTVSLALRDHPRIPVETRERVKAIAARLGYRTNPLVAALMQTRRLGRAVKDVTLAYVTNYPTRYGWRPTHHDRPDFFPGAVQRARELGYKLEDFWLAEPGMTPERFCAILAARGIHGLIIGRLPPGQNSLPLDWSRFSCVALGMTLRSPQLHHVTENHFDTVWQGMQRCLERGYRRVGFVFSEANDSPRVGDRWLGAYLRQQLNLPAKHRLPPCPAIPADEAEFSRWFEQHRPDAIIATHARPVLSWLKRLGCAVPRDVGLIDLEDHPQLDCAGMRYDPATIGATAVEMLIGLMHRNEKGVPETNQHEVLLTGEWRDGTTLPPRRLWKSAAQTLVPP